MVTRRNALSSLIALALSAFVPRRAKAAPEVAQEIDGRLYGPSVLEKLNPQDYTDERRFVPFPPIYSGPVGPASDGRYGFVADPQTARKLGIGAVTVGGIDFTKVAYGGDDRSGYLIVRDWEGCPANPGQDAKLTYVEVPELTQRFATEGGEEHTAYHVRVRPTRIVFGDVRFHPKGGVLFTGPDGKASGEPFTLDEIAFQAKFREAYRAKTGQEWRTAGESFQAKIRSAQGGL